jgi:predicted ATPase/DNA-binding SARP family transcriptional activator
MQHLKIALLGSPIITLDGKPIETERRKAVGLLAYLAVEGRTFSREALAAMLWPDYPRASAFSYLRRTLWELNQMLGKEWIEASRDSVSLARNSNLEIDVRTFRDVFGESIDQVEDLRQAVELYRGDFLEGLIIADTAPFEEWQNQQVSYYHRQFEHVLERLVGALEKNGAYQEALVFAERWLSMDRLNEAAYRAIMRQMAGLGDRSGVARIYQTCVQTLKDELGVEPQAETETLYRSILQEGQKVSAEGGDGKTARPKAIQFLNNLPNPGTPFIGRSWEVEQITQLIANADIHLLTLVGPGGTGKTRLSIQVASEQTNSFADGVWFIPLVAVQSAQGLLIAIAKGINYTFFKGAETPEQQLLDYLRNKQLLLVLDNFEQLLEPGRELIAKVIGATQKVKILVTSRERLNLQAEQIFHVAGMRVPEPELIASWDDPSEQAKPFSAIQLLIERARRRQPEFQLNCDNLEAVADICRLVDGSPLGIELAVDWLEVLPPEEIVREIAHDLDFLESVAADVPERQRSLRVVFDTSWCLLNEAEQHAFKRLCTFQGSFSRQAAQVVSGYPLRTLLSLANKSWLQQAENGRYQLHEVLRQYGMEYLEADQSEWQEARDRLAEYFATFVQVQEQVLRTSNQIRALEAIKIELESNIPQAWAWLVFNGRISELIDKMLAGIFHYGVIRSGEVDFISLLTSARKAVTSNLDQESMLQGAILETVEIYFEIVGAVVFDQPRERMKQLWDMVNRYQLEDKMGFWDILLIADYGAIINYDEASQRLHELLPKITNYTDPWNLGYGYLLVGEFTKPEQWEIRQDLFTKALEVFRQIGAIHEQGVTFHALAEQAAIARDYEKAIDYCQKARKIFEQVGDSWGIDWVWTNLGEYYIYLGKIDQAFRVFEEMRHFSEKIGNKRMLGVECSWESLQVSRYGNLEQALALREKSLEIAIEVNNSNDIAWHTWEMGEIYRLMGNPEHARKYYQDALPLFEKLQDNVGIGFYHRGEGDLARMREDWEIAREHFEKALEYHGKVQQSNSPWGYIYYHSRLGSVLLELGEHEKATAQIKLSLDNTEKWPFLDVKAVAVVGTAGLLKVLGKLTRAIEVAACVESKATTWNEVKQEASEILKEARQGVSEQEAQEAQQRGVEMDIEELRKQLLQDEDFK